MKIKTIIKTPQFAGGKIKDYTIQEGSITEDWIFEPTCHISGSVGAHKVQFKDKNDWQKYEVK